MLQSKSCGFGTISDVLRVSTRMPSVKLVKVRSCKQDVSKKAIKILGDKTKTEPMNFLITPTKIKQNYFDFVHLNFCLCMVIPQSFSNLGCFAQKLCSLQNMFQMTSLAFETDSHPLRKNCQSLARPPLWGFL